MNKHVCWVLLCCMFLAAREANAVRPSKTQEQLQNDASHIVVGEVMEVYSRIRTEEGTARPADRNAKELVQGEWETTKFVAEIWIKTVEKGSGVKAGGLVYVRYWQRRWIGPKTSGCGGGGHIGVPDVGDQVRVYFAKNARDRLDLGREDDGFHVLGPNGFTVIASKRDPSRA